MTPATEGRVSFHISLDTGISSIILLLSSMSVPSFQKVQTLPNPVKGTQILKPAIQKSIPENLRRHDNQNIKPVKLKPYSVFLCINLLFRTGL